MYLERVGQRGGGALTLGGTLTLTLTLTLTTWNGSGSVEVELAIWCFFR